MSRRRSATGPPFRGPIRWELVPKPGGDVRRLVVLTPPDQLAFARSVARAIPAIRRVSDGASHANRIVAWDPARGPVLEPWTCARARWRRDVRHLGNDRRFVAVTDARACYASISPIVLTRRLIALGSARDLRRRDRIVAARLRRCGRRRPSGGSRRFGVARRRGAVGGRRCDPRRGRGARPLGRRRGDLRARRAHANRCAPGAPPVLGVVRPGAPRREDRSVRRPGGRRHVRSDHVGCAPACSTLR